MDQIQSEHQWYSNSIEKHPMEYQCGDSWVYHFFSFALFGLVGIRHHFSDDRAFELVGCDFVQRTTERKSSFYLWECRIVLSKANATILFIKWFDGSTVLVWGKSKSRVFHHEAFHKSNELFLLWINLTCGFWTFSRSSFFIVSINAKKWLPICPLGKCLFWIDHNEWL